MKRAIIISIVALVAGLCPYDTFAQTPGSSNDSIATALRLNGLRERRGVLEQRIKEEDSKRNRQIAGVKPETLEMLNVRQDSVCLALRSELVDVILEIKELSADPASPQLLKQYQKLKKQNDQTPVKNEENAQPTVPPALIEKSGE